MTGRRPEGPIRERSNRPDRASIIAAHEMWNRASAEQTDTPRPTVGGLYQRLAGDRGVVRERDVRTYLEGLDLGAGARGIGSAVDRFMRTFDLTGSGAVTWREFVCGGQRAIPPEFLDPAGRVDKARVDRLTDVDRATAEELVPHIRREIVARSGSPWVALYAGAMARAASKLALDLLDADGDRTVDRADVHALIDDFNRAVSRAGCDRFCMRRPRGKAEAQSEARPEL